MTEGDPVKKTHSIDMCSGPLGKKILLFALPLMAANVLQRLFNLADVIVVGKFAGDLSQAAVTSTTSMINLMLAIFMGLSGGANVVIARALGAREDDRVKDIVHTCILLGIVCGVALTVIGMIISPWLLTLIKSPDNVRGLSMTYLRIYFLGVPATLVYNFASAILRANGDTKRPMYFLILAGIINVALNLISVIGFGMGVAGVAIATVVSQYVSTLLVVRCLQREDGALHLDLRRLRIRWAALGQIARIGIPAGLQASLFSLSNTVIQSSVNSLDAMEQYKDVVIAGSGAAMTIEGICYTFPGALFYTAMPFVSQNYGAKRLDRVDRSFLWCHLYSFLVAMLVSVVTVSAGGVLMRLFTNDPAVVAQGQIRIRIIISMLFLGSAMDVCTATLRGMGWSVVPMIVTLAGVCGLRLAWMATVFRADPRPESIYIAYPITWAVTIVCHLVTIFIARRRIKRRFAEESGQTC